jgi:hypothetical protein
MGSRLPHQAEDAEAKIYRAPLLDDAHEKISVEQGRGRSLRLEHRQESLEAALTELLGGEALTLRLRPDDRPKRHGAENSAERISIQAGRLSRRAETWSSSKAAGLKEVLSMPVMDPEARALMHELALPLDPPRRDAFLAAITERLEASPAIGPGAVMAARRELQRQYFDAPNLHDGQTGRRV